MTTMVKKTNRVTPILDWAWLDHEYRLAGGECLICGCKRPEDHQKTIAERKVKHDQNAKKEGYPVLFSRYGQNGR